MKKIIDEFIEATPGYIETLKQCKDGMCFVCGMKAESMEKLVEEIKILQEKAWKYDELNK